MSFDYTMFPSDKTRLKQGWIVTDRNGNWTDNFNIEGLNVTAIGIMTNVIGKIPTGSSVVPYGVFGIGLHILSASDLRVVLDGQTLAERRAPDNSTNFGMNFGAGVEFGLSRRTKLFFDAKYSLVFTSGTSTSYIPLTFGVSF